MSRRTIVVLVTCAVVVAACGSSETAENTTTAVPVKPEATVTYNGEDCVYEGPDTMTSGLVDFTYVNETEREVLGVVVVVFSFSGSERPIFRVAQEYDVFVIPWRHRF